MELHNYTIHVGVRHNPKLQGYEVVGVIDKTIRMDDGNLVERSDRLQGIRGRDHGFGIPLGADEELLSQGGVQMRKFAVATAERAIARMQERKWKVDPEVKTETFMASRIAAARKSEGKQ